jgi:hypothetical protein
MFIFSSYSPLPLVRFTKNPPPGFSGGFFRKFSNIFFELLPHRSSVASQRGTTEMRHIVTEAHLRWLVW